MAGLENKIGFRLLIKKIIRRSRNYKRFEKKRN